MKTDSYIQADQSSLTVPSPAKLNLMLHIIGRRPDGYHNLQTLFQFIDYGDQLTFSKRSDRQVILTPAIAGVANDDNLIIRAVRKLEQEGQCKLGLNISLSKRLPMGGGLGGGSSNAATTLLAVNHLFGLGFSIDQLAEIGLTLGADVPVFVRGQAAFAEGVGERLTPTPDIEEPWYLVVCPNVHVDTGKIFSHEGLTRDSRAINMRTALEQDGRNDFQQIVSTLYPEVGNALNLLNKFSLAKMTGSGSCVFSRFDSKQEAIAVSEQLPAETVSFVAKGSNISPAHRILFRPS